MCVCVCGACAVRQSLHTESQRSSETCPKVPKFVERRPSSFNVRVKSPVRFYEHEPHRFHIQKQHKAATFSTETPSSVSETSCSVGGKN